ncbi:thioredoxin family protein [Nocardia sp. CNY236]|uniref:thioredoxin family protein n=1 Tax=Nocardia sp. CNY236 TaxID=1169152 RepID=UPI00042323BE|nr:thioredoxin family protein [Nocardia sp. CNY236]
MIEITVLAVVALAVLTVGFLLRRHGGKVRAAHVTAASGSTRAGQLTAVGMTGDGPAIVHFSAEWCGPCEAVRRVVANVTDQLAQSPRPPQDIEVDIDAEPALARELNVLSLPTTFVFDAEGTERFRISGVPKATDLRSAVESLTTAA